VPKSRPIPEKRTSRRFPLQLPVAVKDHAQSERTETHDISAGGVLFYTDSKMDLGSRIEFSISFEASLSGAPRDVLVNCVGRVVRCRKEGQRHAVAAVIDEYHFERA
jgi:PilZ domain-containing protein